ncbi:MAG: discoidin domain-containing protein, partial [Myxococcota bacterium]
RIEEIGDASAIFRFETSVETTCEAEFGLSATALTERAQDPNMDPNNPYAIDHEVPLGGLIPATTYWVRARAEARDGTLAYSEVQSFTTLSTPSTDMINVARMQMGSSIAGVSSNFGNSANDGTWGANNAIDGSPGTEWSSNGDGNDAFIVIDLGQSRTIEMVRFQSRQMTDGTSIIQRITLTANDVTYVPFDTPSPDQMYSFTLEPAVATSSVRIDAVDTTGGNTGAREIELLGPP